MSHRPKSTAGLSPEEKRALLGRLLWQKTRSSKRFPLSFAQERLWFLHQLDPNSSFYNIPFAVRLIGRLDVAALQQTLSEIVSRHETLRTTLLTVDGLPMQVVSAAKPLVLPLVDLCGLPAIERNAEVGRLVIGEARDPFDLGQGPLVRFRLLRLSDSEHVVLFNMHHIIGDGWSVGVLVREIVLLYEAFLKRRPSPLADLPTQYADYTLWQRERLNGEVLEEQLHYWRKQFGDSPAMLKLPTDRPRPPVQSYCGATESLILSEELTEPLKALSRQEGVTLFMTLLAGFKALLHRYTGQQDISVGTPIAGRTRAELEGLIGFFVNTLVIRTDLSGDPTFIGLLRRVRNVALGAYAHQEVPFEKLVEELRPLRSLSHTPLFQVMFTLQNASRETLQLPGLELSPLAAEIGTSKFDLTLTVSEADVILSASFEYNTDLFNQSTIKRMLKHFGRLLQGVAANPDERISRLPLLFDRERHQIITEWNDTRSDYPKDIPICQLFEQQVERSPQATALVFGEDRLSYAELNRRANQLAHYLRKKGVGQEVQVGVCVERGIEMVVAMLGILKSGAAYVPLDPSFPRGRLAFMLHDALVQVVLTQTSLLSLLPDHHTRLICLDSDRQMISSESRMNPPGHSFAESLAYVMYTSGSTGKPKGIAIPHRAISRLVLNTNYIDINPADAVAQASNSSFDAATLEIWGALLSGARLVCVSREAALTPGELSKQVQQQSITIMFLTTALFNQIAGLQPEVFRGLNQLLFGGEVADASTLSRVFESGGPRRLVNAYGPTESTTFATCEEVTEVSKGAVTVPIGRPIANTRVYILGERLEMAPVGVAGELYIGGDGLARGYFNRPELTAERFLPNPYSDGAGERMYRTGDVARYLEDGRIEFVGRLDHQVKVRGFRIELGEIEAVLAQHPAVREAVVTLREDEPWDKRLVAFVVSGEGQSLLAVELRSYLKEKLPEYMIPSAIICLDKFPLTPHGKIDREALPEADQRIPVWKERLIRPRDALELQMAQIWEDILGIRPVGVRDDFFDLGGHSLLAVRLMARIRKAFDKSLPLAVLFQAATVENLAACLRHHAYAVPWSPLVAIQPGRSRQPFFCVHPGGGNGLCYVGLSRHLGSDQPFYAFQSAGVDHDQPVHTGIEEMAACYIEAMRTVQPEAPYLLGGWSMGGIVAFEMAGQLLAQNQQVALLALIDARVPKQRRKPEDDLALMLSFGQDLGLSLSDLTLCHERLSQIQLEDQLAYVLEQAKGANLVPPDVTLSDVGRLFRVFKSNVEAMLSYRPKACGTRISLFRAGGRCAQSSAELVAEWRELTDRGVDEYEVPGDHFTIMQEPGIHAMAERLRACIDEAVVSKRPG